MSSSRQQSAAAVAAEKAEFDSLLSAADRKLGYLWPDIPRCCRLKEVHTAVGSFQVPCGALNPRLLARALSYGEADEVSTRLCMQRLARWDNRVELCSYWGHLILSSEGARGGWTTLQPLRMELVAFLLRHRGWLAALLTDNPPLHFHDIARVCEEAQVSPRRAVDVLTAACEGRLSGFAQLERLAKELKEDEDDGPDEDLPRIKVDAQDMAAYFAYLQRYLRRNQHDASRKKQATDRIEATRRFVFDIAQPFRIVGYDTQRSGYLQVKQGGQSKRVLESALSDEKEAKVEVRTLWLQWRVRSAQRLQELENGHSKKHPRVLDDDSDDDDDGGKEQSKRPRVC